jgi:hypothetical protein
MASFIKGKTGDQPVSIHRRMQKQVVYIPAVKYRSATKGTFDNFRHKDESQKHLNE